MGLLSHLNHIIEEKKTPSIAILQNIDRLSVLDTCIRRPTNYFHINKVIWNQEMLLCYIGINYFVL